MGGGPPGSFLIRAQPSKVKKIWEDLISYVANPMLCVTLNIAVESMGRITHHPSIFPKHLKKLCIVRYASSGVCYIARHGVCRQQLQGIQRCKTDSLFGYRDIPITKLSTTTSWNPIEIFILGST